MAHARVRLLTLRRTIARRSAERALSHFPTSVRSARTTTVPASLSAPLIVSLTSFPKRFGTLALTLKSLLLQSLTPDRLILWVAADAANALPTEVVGLGRYGLEIRTCSEFGPAKKLVPALAAFPDAYIATADDDTYYPPSWLADLVGQLDPLCPRIIARRAHLARFESSGAAKPYRDWDLETDACATEGPDAALFATGVGGILYPPHSLAADVSDVTTLMELCPFGDDIWFAWMARLAGTSVARVPGRFQIVNWRDTQTGGLFRENLDGGRNDRQIAAMQMRYGYFRDLGAG
jgi:hypothetical protein